MDVNIEELIPAKKIEKIYKALVKRRTEANAGKLSLLDDEEKVLVTFTVSKALEPSNKPKLFPLPHSPWPEDVEICLIVKDPGAEIEAQVLEQQKLRSDAPCRRVTKVLGMTKLKNEYKSFEDKRKLASSYDLFVADDRVIAYMPKLLGKPFYKHQKTRPIPVSLVDKNLNTVMHRVLNSSVYSDKGGSCIAMSVAETNFKAEHVAANVLACIQAFIKKRAGGLAVVKSIFLKTASSMAVPLYYSDEDDDIVQPAATTTTTTTTTTTASSSKTADDAEATAPVPTAAAAAGTGKKKTSSGKKVADSSSSSAVAGKKRNRTESSAADKQPAKSVEKKKKTKKAKKK